MTKPQHRPDRVYQEEAWIETERAENAREGDQGESSTGTPCEEGRNGSAAVMERAHGEQHKKQHEEGLASVNAARSKPSLGLVPRRRPLVLGSGRIRRRLPVSGSTSAAGRQA